jgi:hypothetical protein
MIKVEASLIGSLGLNPNTVRRGESSRLAFLLPVASVLHTIISTMLVAWKNRLGAYLTNNVASQRKYSDCKRLSLVNAYIA